MAEQWEYLDVQESTVVSTPAVRVRLGENGWELAGIINRVKGAISATGGTIDTEVTYVFKRRKPGR